ncbi:hypothetical protein TrVE_jg8947 [Triparma verrucosa]|uniref:Uncharacterized protein n=1 Tax=Triparma verrucosa TaxID=1606542 RepID=A0A9W6ZCA0_9STRA|nr:hypothetical protein TrVE_jg8947 [Triparma verrucosa]
MNAKCDVEKMQMLHGGIPVKDVHLITGVYRKLEEDWEDEVGDNGNEFWDVAFMECPPPNYLVPSTEDLASEEFDDGDLIVKRIFLGGREIKFNCFLGDGVLNNVGLESWDAGYVLLGVLMDGEYDEGIKARKVLELGAGCGFVSKGLEYLDFKNLTASDFDDGVIKLLKKNVETTEVKKIDWFKTETYNCDDKYDLIIGSAVVYSPEHKVLTNVIDSLLQEGGSALIINMRRPGWDEFVLSLEDTFGAENITVQLVTDEQVKAGEKIKREEIQGTFNICRIIKKK